MAIDRRLVSSGSVIIDPETIVFGANTVNVAGTATGQAGSLCKVFGKIVLRSINDPEDQVHPWDFPTPRDATLGSPTNPINNQWLIQNIPLSDSAPLCRLYVWGIYESQNFFERDHYDFPGSGSGNLSQSTSESLAVSQAAPRGYKVTAAAPTKKTRGKGKKSGPKAALDSLPVTLTFDDLSTTPSEAFWSAGENAKEEWTWTLSVRSRCNLRVAKLAVFQNGNAAGQTLVWEASNWSFLKPNTLVADEDNPLQTEFPGLQIEPA
jgi:hypothetical protein